MSASVRMAAVQAEPVWFDVAATTAKTVKLIGEAAESGAQIIAFPELWLPGYPMFVMGAPAMALGEYIALNQQNSLSVDGPELALIAQAARRHDMTVVVGFSERHFGSLYMSQAIIDGTGEMLLHRRKIKPTFHERMFFGEGDGSGLQVVETSMGRIGALNCWEHINPLVKFSLYAQHEQIHVAGWPVLLEGGDVTSAATSLAISQVYAVEGQVFVAVASQIMSADGAKALGLGDVPPELTGGGHASIFAPSGRLLTEPIPSDAEGFVLADLDFAEIDAAKSWADFVGHYSRNDIFSLTVDRTRRTPATLSDPGPAELPVHADQPKAAATGRQPAAEVENSDLTPVGTPLEA